MSHYSFADLVDFGSVESYERLDFPPPKPLPATEPEGPIFRLESGLLADLARRAFSEIAFFLPAEQLAAFAAVVSDPRASQAERFVAAQLIRNAAAAAEGLYPLCQDTGTAVVYGWKGSRMLSDGRDEVALAEGAARAYQERRLRNSQLGPLGFLAERNTGDNLPAMIDLRSSGAAHSGEYRLVFAAKGGGSANRTTFSMESPALLQAEALADRLERGISALGAGACPPYRLGLVLGGASPDQALYALSLATLGLLDRLPTEGSEGGALRDREWEDRLMALAEKTGVGAQFGGRHLAIDARAIRLSRHAASLSLALGVSCSAHRHARSVLNAEGVFLERLERDPARFLPAEEPVLPGARSIDLDLPPEALRSELSSLEAGSFLLLSGTVVTARDAAHARFKALLESGRRLPAYLSNHPVFYAGPTEAAPGRPSGSFGPTTAGRMDGYLDMLMERGASLVSIAKGGRSSQAAAAIGRRGGAYLACIGGAAALAARDHIVSSEVIDYADLGMEAVRAVRLRDLPAVLAIDARGRDFYARP
ncbi:MAG TPA: fumarate hydratase C-terminal domain-containing protein [Rectinemataceae bacterium]|nr:fumarate hydratase C-terminal domain-containing protein [Rectinemataceae bacterium]